MRQSNQLLSYHSLNPDLAALLLRPISGGLFVRYVYNKVIAYDQILPMFRDLIGTGSKRSINLLILAKFFCGFLLLIDFFTRLAVIPIFIAMAVAFCIAHAKDPFDVKGISLCVFAFINCSFCIGQW